MPPCADRHSQQNKEIQEPWVWAQTQGKAVLEGSVVRRSLILSPGQGAFMTFDSGGSNGRVCLQCRRPGFNPWMGKIPRRRGWQPPPGFSPGESHGQRSLVVYSHRVAESRTQLSD